MPKILLSGCLFTVLAFSSNLHVCADECVTAVFAKRNNMHKPEGSSLSIGCDVHHCKQKWTGGWGVRQQYFTFLNTSQRVHISNGEISQDVTRLTLTIHNLNQSDSGLYMCNINWGASSSQGHVTQVNVTAGSSEQFMPESTGRKLSYRLLVCAAASLCFPLALALARCFPSDVQPPPPVPPPRSRYSSTVRVKPKADVVYTTLTLTDPRRQSAAQAANKSTAVVYSTVSFSTV